MPSCSRTLTITNLTPPPQALSSTVGRDLRASHFKFHDDPYLMPRSNPDKRQFALSQEAGRNAARWIRDHKPELFGHQTAQPFSQVGSGVGEG